MNLVLANGKHPLFRGRFPLASKYDPQWVFDNEIEDGHDLWRDWEAFLADFAPRKPGRSGDLDLLMADKDKDLTFVRLVARKV